MAKIDDSVGDRDPSRTTHRDPVDRTAVANERPVHLSVPGAAVGRRKQAIARVRLVPLAPVSSPSTAAPRGLLPEQVLGGRVPNDEKRRQYLQIIVSESERLTALIENVLDFARVERGKAAYEFARGSVAEVATRAVDMYRYRAEREEMTVELTIAEGLPEALIDARALELSPS